MRCSFDDDPGLREPLFELLDGVFPGIRAGAEALGRLGASWEEVSTPYVRFEGGLPVAHVGVIDLPLVIAGRPVTVGSVHAVATRPDRRRRGLFRGLMLEVLDDRRDQTLVLTTENPEYYEPFGFRAVREHRFEIPAPRGPLGKAVRRLDVSDPDDLGVLRRLLATRAPVSRVLGVAGAATVFLFNEARRPLHYLPDLDVVVCLETEGPVVAIYDVVGPELPPLDELVAALGGPVERVVLHFAPDVLAPGAVAVPRVFEHDGPSYLLVRGRFDAERHPFSLPRSART